MFAALAFFALAVASGLSPVLYADPNPDSNPEASGQPVAQNPGDAESIATEPRTTPNTALKQTQKNNNPISVKPKIAIIIDDLGHNYQAGVDSIKLKAPVAVAVLPFTPHSKKLAEYAHKNKQVVMLHLPMQPGAAMHLMTDKTLSIHMMQEDLERNIHAMIEDVPHVVGVNNHMGSLFTQLPDQMQWLMTSLQSKSNELSKDLFFIDSLTSPYSLAYQVANKNNIATARRDVFLDRELNAAHMQAQIERIKHKANAQGYAIAIGHPFPETLALLKKAIPELEAQGYEFVKITELLNAGAQRSALTKQIKKERPQEAAAPNAPVNTAANTEKKRVTQVAP